MSHRSKRDICHSMFYKKFFSVIFLSKLDRSFLLFPTKSRVILYLSYVKRQS
ncbi:hypothetical protein CpB0171 [Chlamydia pneumoniae TW-183]|uniref:Uncharacterized protein n=1 Tax=Chlamydia pneumoniae TaxID=83558 RepID=A0ABN3YPL8_CHLPN|nr:hypothetical protein CpB0171 [Chlamydia pneumoniae TW-183]